MTNYTDQSEQNERRELLDGHAFLMMQSNRMPLMQIAGIANTTEAEVLRLIALAKSAGFRA